MGPLRSCRRRRMILLLFAILFAFGPVAVSVDVSTDTVSVSGDGTGGVSVDSQSGPSCLAEGLRLFEMGDHLAAGNLLWRAVLLHSSDTNPSSRSPPDPSHIDAYEVNDAFEPFLRSYIVRGKAADGLTFVARESYGRQQDAMGELYLNQALAVDPNHAGARSLREMVRGRAGLDEDIVDEDEEDDDDDDDDDEQDLTPEEMYNLGTQLFNKKDMVGASKVFERACRTSHHTLSVACTNAAYCRSTFCDWGANGDTFDRDMRTIRKVTRNEAAKLRTERGNNNNHKVIHWQRSTSVHPHMMLGYPLPDPILKRYAAESFADLDELRARLKDDGTVRTLPSDLPFDHDTDKARATFNIETNDPDFRLKIGFVGAGFNTKAVLYLSHDMFRFFDPDKVEVHVFSTGAPDHPEFIRRTMRGVDWRSRVEHWADEFHNVRHLKDDHIEMARYIRSEGMHVLVEWDGYARQGERAAGLFALRPSPVQILHQEFLGTSGANYIDYIVTDRITSPEETSERLYSEKFMYMPNHFFSKGHAMQIGEVRRPSLGYNAPTGTDGAYALGTGSPRENRCRGAEYRNGREGNNGSDDEKEVSFVFCSFNKFLKNNPETMRSWIRILKETPGSLLCLLENPPEGVPYLRRFIAAAGSERSDERENKNNEDEHQNEEYRRFDDGENLNSRIRFLKWEANPFDHQVRSRDYCDAMLDSHPYNGHTVAQDALFAGVPIVTRSDGLDMSSRVTTSANVVLGLEDLNAHGGSTEYEDIAIQIATNATFHASARTRLVETCLRTDPMHPYWDVPRYVNNFEAGVGVAWERYLSGQSPAHIDVVEGENTRRGTREGDVAAREEARTKRKRVQQKMRLKQANKTTGDDKKTNEL